MEKLELQSRKGNLDHMGASKEERLGSPVKAEFDPFVVEISSSSEKSSTGQAQETGEEATSSLKRSTSQQQFSAETLHKKPRLHAHSDESHEAVGGVLHSESEHLNTSASNAADGISLNDAIEGRNPHNDDIVVDDAVNVVNDNDAGDDDLPDDFLEPLDSPLMSSPPPDLHVKEPVHGHSSATDMAKLMLKQFWKAGDYESAPSVEDFNLASGMEHVRVHPKFLHSNATSHKWALGAIAELLDNALDEAVNGATRVNVDMIHNPRDGRPMLMIEDDGGGMDPACMRQCMSLGYSAKSKVANTIGQYGNGFKTSTMRLGADVVVFSRHKGKDGSLPTQSIGLLSYTFLTATGQDDIIVPMVDYEVHPFGLKKLVRGTLDDWNRNLETLLQWSPYNTVKGLFDHFKRIDSQGTVVIVYNLWENEDGELELDFDADPHDIQLRGANRDEKNKQMASKYPNCKHFFTHKYSLRSYTSILYLRLPKKFKMFLRGEQVGHHKVVSDLMLIEQVKYKPVKASVKSYRDAATVVTLGFVKDAKEHIDVQGFNVYHKNRLIKPFWRVWNYPGIQGRGIFGVLEANFVEPAHDKQGFERTTVFARLESRLIEIQKNYWSNHCAKIGYVGNASRKKAPTKADRAVDDPSSKRTSHPAMPSYVPANTRASPSPRKGMHTAPVVNNKDRVQAVDDPSSERTTHPVMSSHVPVNTRASASLRKSTDTALVVPNRDIVQAVQSASRKSVSSLAIEAFSSHNKTASPPTPSSSATMVRVSSTHSLAEFGMEKDDHNTAALHTSAASMPSIAKEAVVSHEIVKANSTPQTSGAPEASRRADRLKITPYVRVTRSSSIKEGKVQEASSPSVPTVDPVQACLAEGLSRSGNASTLQSERGSIDELEKTDKSTSSLPVHTTEAAIEGNAEPLCAAPESDSRETQATILISASKDRLLSSNEFKAVEDDVPSIPDGHNGALVAISGEPPESDSKEAQAAILISATKDHLLSSSEFSAIEDNVPNIPDGNNVALVPISGEPPEFDSKETKATILISASKDPLLPSSEFKAVEDDVPSIPDGNDVALVVTSGEPPGLQSSLAGDLVALGASQPSLQVSLMSESLQDSNEALISPSSQGEVPESSQCTSGNAANVSLTSTPPTQKGRPRVLTRSMLQLRQSHARAAQLESVNSQQFGNKIQPPVTDGVPDAICLAITTPDEGDMLDSTLVAHGTDEHIVSLDSINTLEEKLDVMKQRLRSLHVELEEIYTERDFLKGELEEERRRQALTEEELQKKLQAVSLQARELEATNKLLQVCQR